MSTISRSRSPSPDRRPGLRRVPSLRDIHPERPEQTHDLLWKLMCDYRPDDKETIQKDIVMHVEYTLARTRLNFYNFHAYQATAYSLRDRLVERFNDTHAFFADSKARMCYYLSLEFLVGRSLRNAVHNLGLEGVYAEALAELGYSLETLYDEEKDAALGNGGLGRLAACFMDSLAKENFPAWGYGLRYTYGMFEQKIMRGEQVEVPDNWLSDGNPWEIERLDVQYPVGFYGSVESFVDSEGTKKFIWHPQDRVLAVAYDIPIPGFRTRNTLNIRLWASRPAKEFDMDMFNRGDYIGAVTLKQESENITSVLYPNDNSYGGKELRLKQQYLLVAATLADITRRFRRSGLPMKDLHTKVTIQLNDTHPALGIPELMRILMDIDGLSWDEAWTVTRNVYNYTNHTVLPEALERWPASLVEALLPRHAQIIYDINHLFLEQVANKWPDNWDYLSEMSIIEEGYEKRFRMASLAIIGSAHVNGVAQLHSDILRTHIFKKFYEMWPEKFQNKTNGVTPRRWIAQCNPGMSDIISCRLGSDDWIADLNLVRGFEKWADDADVHAEWVRVKYENKARLAQFVEQTLGITVDPAMMFDVQIKRIHEYKRQLLNVLGCIHYYIKLSKMTQQDLDQVVPRAIFFAGKAAPGYFMAKRIIKLIHNVANVVNTDPRISKYLKIVYIPNYNVRLAELIVPANDISQHISTAGTEASGTSCMKFAMNAGLIVGTMDGANVEIAEEVGQENMFIFGLRTHEIEEARKHATLNALKASMPGASQSSSSGVDPRWAEVILMLESPTQRFGSAADVQPILQSLQPANDRYCVGLDFGAYIDTLDLAMKSYKNQKEWTKKTILCTCRMGKFSSDNTIRQYANEIWKLEALPLEE